MEMLREFYFSLRKNNVINLLIAIFSFFSLLLFLVLFYFSIHNDQLLNAVDGTLEGVQIFHLSDGGNLFGEDNSIEVPFYLEADGLERLKQFYYETLLPAEFSIASSTSSFFLEIEVNEFPGGEAFQVGYEWGDNWGALPDGRGNYAYQIKAATLDHFAWELSSVEIAIGRDFQAEDFGFFSGTIPVILGHQYTNYYEIGDLITAAYVAFDLEFEVIGILAEHQTIFFDVTDYLVDYYILIPFISFEEPQNEEERDFQTFYYLTKALHTYIFVEDTPDAINHMKNTIHSATAELNIPYFFSSTDHTFIRHSELSNLVHHHLTAINQLLLSSALLIGVIVLVLSKIKYHRQAKTYQVQMLLGIPKYKLWMVLIIENLIIYSLVIFSALYYAIFYSGIMFTRNQLTFFTEHNISRWSLFWEHLIYDSFSFYHLSLQPTALYGIFLLFISIVYPSIKLNQLYKGGHNK